MNILTHNIQKTKPYKLSNRDKNTFPYTLTSLRTDLKMNHLSH